MINEKIPNQDNSVPSMINVMEVAASQGHVIKYYKADLDDPSQVIVLQNIETEGLKGDKIVVVKKDTYVFMDRFFIVIQYLEKTNA